MVIADSGFWVALFNRSDPLHQKALDALALLEEGLITTWPVLTEATHLLLRAQGRFLALKFIEEYLSGPHSIYELSDNVTDQIPKLMRKYSELPMDLADASLVLLAEHLGHGRILSTDRRDFRTYRWKERKPFENLML